MTARQIALTRAVAPSIADCELTCVERTPIDPARAAAEHAAYEQALRDLGCEVRRVPPAPGLPDSVFVEDIAVVFPELAVLARPGAASRRDEAAPVAETLSTYRDLARIKAPATLDGGDVLVMGRRIFVGQSRRTNREGVEQLAERLEPHGYRVESVAVDGCLHLKTAATAVADGVVVANSAWLPADALPGIDRIEIDPAEPFAANVVRIGDTLLCSSAYPRTRERLERHGLQVRTVEAGELARAEGGLTCCSLIFEA